MFTEYMETVSVNRYLYLHFRDVGGEYIVQFRLVLDCKLAQEDRSCLK